MPRVEVLIASAAVKFIAGLQNTDTAASTCERRCVAKNYGLAEKLDKVKTATGLCQSVYFRAWARKYSSRLACTSWTLRWTFLSMACTKAEMFFPDTGSS